MRRRRGRPRKTGPRYRSGHRVKAAVSPREVAASMPHRRGLGEKATDQRAESELGRLVLRGDLDATLGLAGETYLGLWRGYVFSLGGPRELSQGGEAGFTCDGCEVPKHCRCWFRRKVFEEAQQVLFGCHAAVVWAVEHVVIHDYALTGRWDIHPLRAGLSALADHFGLTPRGKSSYQNAASQIASAPASS